jgi:cytidyltransferase-like protein
MSAIIVTKNEALALAKESPIALTSGSFDLLHAGHRYLFNQAKIATAPAKLLVLILDDANIKSRKGDLRPVNTLALRIAQLQNVVEIDFILPWNEPWEGIAEFVSRLKPAFFIAVNGDPGLESKRKTVETAGGKFILIQKLAGFSTSAIIKKLKNS